MATAAAVCCLALAQAGSADAAKCTQKGTGGVDILKGTTKKDVLCAKGGADVLIGKGGNDVLKGGAGDDSLIGKAGNDSLAAGAGNDTLGGGKGNDKLKGQAGVDLAGFSDSASPVHVDLAAGTASGNGDDTMLTIEKVIGSPADDELIGGPGPDDFSGGEGNDLLVGAGGDDVLHGQGGFDSTTYAAAPGPIVADLRAGTVTGDGADSLAGIERLTGSPSDDAIGGDGADNALDGGAGHDVLSFASAPGPVDADLGAQGSTGDGTDSLASFADLVGSDAADRLTGDDDTNLIDGRGGDDVMIGLKGNDRFEGGAGDDRAAYIYATSPITADLRAGTVTGEGNDTLASVEDLTGSGFGDLLAGSAAGNVIDGAGGSDTISFTAAPVAIDSSLGTGVTAGDGTDTLLGIENAIGSPHDDSIEGSSANNAIAGGLGADTLAAAGGDDQLIGEEGADRLFGALDDDDISGGPGDDHLDGGDGVNECDGGSGTNTYAGNCDGNPPVLTTLNVVQDSVDTSLQSRNVDFTLHLTDDAAGVDAQASAVIIHAPSGSPTFEAPLTRTSGDDLAGDYSAQINLPRYSAQGTWTVEVRLVDQSANQTTMTTQQLTTAGQEHSFDQNGVGDTAAPTLDAFGFTPASVNTSAASANLNFTFTLSDDLAGVDPAASRVVIHGPGGDPSYEMPLTLASGNPLAGDYTAQITLPRYSAQGTWTIELLLVDGAANQLTVSGTDLGSNATFTQNGTGDTIAPALTGFTLDSPTINTAEVDQTINFTVDATDALAGVDPAASRVIALDPVNQPRGESPLTLQSGNPQNGHYTASIVIPQGSATGTWRLRVRLVDQVGNVRVLNYTDLVAAGLPNSFQNVAPSGA